MIRRAGTWLNRALQDAPRWAQWGPYWVVSFACALLMSRDEPGAREAGIVLIAFGPFLAHILRYALGGSATTYRYGYTCRCGLFKVSTSDQPTLTMLRDAHRSTCKAVQS